MSDFGPLGLLRQRFFSILWILIVSSTNLYICQAVQCQWWNLIKQDACFIFVVGGFKNKIKEEYGFVGSSEENPVVAKWASVLSKSKDLAKGNCPTPTGWNAEANQNLYMLIWLQLKEDGFVPSNQVDDWILCAELIQLCVDSAANTVILTKQNINKFMSTLKEICCPYLEAKSDKEQNLLIKSEELEDLVEYQEVQINKLEGDIQDFCCDLHEAHEDIFGINSE